jgi:hypothetical protein
VAIQSSKVLHKRRSDVNGWVYCRSWYFNVNLGDRHGENILFEQSTGACLHVDLNWYMQA